MTPGHGTGTAQPGDTAMGRPGAGCTRPVRGRLAGSASRTESGPSGGLPVRIRVVHDAELDSRRGASNTPGMVDPLVLALAQLVRDRYAAEQAERRTRRGRLRLVEGRR